MYLTPAGYTATNTVFKPEGKEQLLLLSLPQVKHQEREPPTRSVGKHQHSHAAASSDLEFPS